MISAFLRTFALPYNKVVLIFTLFLRSKNFVLFKYMLILNQNIVIKIISLFLNVTIFLVKFASKL